MNSYTLHITLYDLFFFGMICIGLAFALLLAFAGSVNRAANRFLALALTVIILWMVRIWTINLRLDIRLPLQFLLALGPLTYFYVLNLTRPSYKFTRKDLLHFSPVLLAQVAFALEMRESARTGAATYATSAFHLLNPVSELLIFISVMAYLYRSRRLIARFYRHLRPVQMDRSRLEFRWLRRLLAATALLWLLWIAYAAGDYFGYLRIRYPFYIFFAVIGIWTAVAALLKPQAGLMARAFAAPKLPPPVELKEKASWLKKAMEANLYHRDAELNLNLLAEKLGVNSRELSGIINTVLKKNFTDFINEYRVRDVARKMQDPAYDRITLLGMAWEAGFNSKSTFNRIFKQMTGKSPVEYKLELKKEFPSRDLGRYLKFAPVVLTHETTPKWYDEKLTRNYMFKNYLKIVARNFWANRMFTLINVVGLSVGTTAALVICLIVHFDFTFDRFHKNGDRIFRVVTTSAASGPPSYNAGISGAAITIVKDRLTGVEATAEIFSLYQPDVMVPFGQKTFKAQDNVILADGGYFRLFTYTWLAGAAAHALSEPNKVVLTARQGKRYFPSLDYSDMIGRTVMYDSLRVSVSGIVADSKAHTDLTFHDFISFSTAAVTPALNTQVLINTLHGTTPERQLFVMLTEQSSAGHLTQQLNQLYTQNYPPAQNHAGRQSFELQPLADLHFNANYGTYGNGRVANKATLYQLSAIGAFLLLLGCINFVNLATAQSVKRAKEIGIRKTMGSSRGQLIAQFIMETFLIALVAVSLSAVMAPFFLQYFAGFIPAGVNANLISQPGILLFLLLLAAIVALAAGFYPAMILSGYKPVSVLRGQAQSDSSKTRTSVLRKSLTVTQFVIAQFFIMATISVGKQIYYALNKDLGFKKDAILIVNSPWKDRQPGKAKVFMDKLNAIPQVELVGAGRDAPMSDDPHTASAIYRDGKKEVRVDKIGEKFGDRNYISVYHIKLLAGRNLQPQDTVNTVLINQNLAHLFGFNDPHEAIGKSIAGFNGKPQTQIVGVVADFHQESIHAPILPLAIFTSTNPYFNGTFHIALKPQTGTGNYWRSAISGIQAAWKEIYPGEEFSYQFFDQSIAQLYSTEQNTAKLLDWATGLSVVISCLGLLGLTIYTANQRKNEIGIRKVLGASAGQMVLLLSSELTILIAIAFVIAMPLAWLAMHKWLQSFADRTTINWWIFALSGGGMLLAALFTSGLQTFKAALANPVKSLRSE